MLRYLPELFLYLCVDREVFKLIRVDEEISELLYLTDGKYSSI